jgi:hypothetical protein
MQMAITFMAVVAGLIFSIAVALLAEELIFGQVFRLFFARPTAASPQRLRSPATRNSFRGAEALHHPNASSAQ